ncbi:hypothetical protein IG631_04890 [Alternaria alternata]|nr:hypothetical protein IG631_04890 [Alternaria alternata]
MVIKATGSALAAGLEGTLIGCKPHSPGYCFTVRYLEDCSVVPTYFAVTHILTGIGRVKRVYGLLQDLPVHNLLSRFRRPIKQRAVDHLSNCLYYPYPKR